MFEKRNIGILRMRTVLYASYEFLRVFRKYLSLLIFSDDKMTKICGIHDQKCTDKVEADFNQYTACKCLPLCNDTKYAIEVRQADQAT